MRRNRKIRKMEPWYRRLFERIKENRNRINRGTTEPKILENPFISRAYDKIMRNHRNHVLGMCLSGIIGGTFLFLIWDALCQAVLGVSSREWLGRGMDQILTSLFFGLSFCGYGYVENTVFHSMDHVLLKYWTCPFCHRELPYKVESVRTSETNGSICFRVRWRTAAPTAGSGSASFRKKNIPAGNDAAVGIRTMV